jgi:hypothetical protein
LLGTIGLPAAIIGGISGGIAAAPYIGKALANPWVQRGLTGLDVIDTGVQVASGNYLGAAANWIPYDKISDIFGKARRTSRVIKEGAKNLYNRYTAPITSIKHTPYKGDQLQLAKFRLVNGGFDKLGINPKDVVYIPTTHAMATPINNSDVVNKSDIINKINTFSTFNTINKLKIEEPINARKFLLKSEPEALRTQVDGTAYYSPARKIYTSPSFGKPGKLDGNTKLITAHEFQHAVDDVVNIQN